jgi:hypothetical protein
VHIPWASVICWNIYSGKAQKNSCKYVPIIISSSIFQLWFYGMEISIFLKGIMSDETGKASY